MTETERDEIAMDVTETGEIEMEEIETAEIEMEGIETVEIEMEGTEKDEIETAVPEMKSGPGTRRITALTMVFLDMHVAHRGTTETVPGTIVVLLVTMVLQETTEAHHRGKHGTVHPHPIMTCVVVQMAGVETGIEDLQGTGDGTGAETTGGVADHPHMVMVGTGDHLAMTTADHETGMATEEDQNPGGIAMATTADQTTGDLRDIWGRFGLMLCDTGVTWWFFS